MTEPEDRTPISAATPGSDPLPVPGDAELERLRRGVTLMALRALGDRNAAEEVAQETVVRVLTALNAGRRLHNGDVPAYAHGVARRVIALRFRERARHRLRPLPPDGGPRALSAPGPDPLSAVVAAETRERVRRALAALTDRDREVLRLVFYDGLKPGAAARELGEPADRIRKRKSRALERLRRVFFGLADHTAGRTDGEDPRGGDGSAASIRREAPGLRT